MKTHLDLFSGIGGFALAAHWAGYTTVGFCEYEDYPRRVLARHWPGVQCHGDIRNLDGTAYRGVDLLTGGFPCQPFSSAGDQKGSADDRFLWPEMLRVIKQAQPAWVVAENVAGLINMALDEVLADLEAANYATGTAVIPACAVGAPHRRDRVWIIARNTNSNGEPTGSVNAEMAKLPGDVVNADSSKCHRSRTPLGVQPKLADAGSFGGWAFEPPVDRVADGLSGRLDKTRRERLKAIGNAIVPQVAYEIIKQLN